MNDLNGYEIAALILPFVMIAIAAWFVWWSVRDIKPSQSSKPREGSPEKAPRDLNEALAELNRALRNLANIMSDLSKGEHRR